MSKTVVKQSLNKYKKKNHSHNFHRVISQVLYTEPRDISCKPRQIDTGEIYFVDEV